MIATKKATSEAMMSRASQWRFHALPRLIRALLTRQQQGTVSQAPQLQADRDFYACCTNPMCCMGGRC